MQPISDNHPLRRLFAGMVENAFCTEVGICDPSLLEYLSDLLVNFTHVDQLNALRNAAGKRLEELAAMLALAYEEQDRSTTERDREVYRHIGDYSLFWAGLYPEQLKRIRYDSPDVLLDYVCQGKRCYAIASNLATPETEPPSTLLLHLSEEFEECIHGLGLVRRTIERTLPDGGNHGNDLVL